MEYKYGMRLRGFSIGCQPDGVIRREDAPNDEFYDIIVYDRPLSEEDIRHYSLTPIVDEYESLNDLIPELETLYAALHDFVTKSGLEYCEDDSYRFTKVKEQPDWEHDTIAAIENAYSDLRYIFGDRLEED